MTIDSICIGNITTLATFNRSTANTHRSDVVKPTQKGVQQRMFCCTPFVLFLRRVWVDGVIVNVEYFGEGVTCFLNKSRNENSINH